MKTKRVSGTVRVSWVKPLISGGAAITGYRITIIPISFSLRTQPKLIVLKVGPKARSVVFPHLHPRLYIAEVSGVNKHGVGPPGAAIYPSQGGEVFISFGP